MKKPAGPKSLSERVIFPISRDMLDRIDDYRYRRRIPSRADAIRRLIELSLNIEAHLGEPVKVKRVGEPPADAD
jgi:metal-responsive CopG/Arc/MetJ family transcriptional regulator